MFLLFLALCEDGKCLFPLALGIEPVDRPLSNSLDQRTLHAVGLCRVGCIIR